MRLRGAGRAPTRVIVVALLVVLLLAFVLPPGSAIREAGLGGNPGSAAHAELRPAGGPIWDNGVVHLGFLTPYPWFKLVSDQDPRVVSSTSLTAVAEVDRSGNVTSVAHFQAKNVTWSFSSSLTPGGTAIAVDAWLPVAGSHGGWESDDGYSDDEGSTGKAHVTIAFYLNGSNGTSPTTLRFTVNVTHWPWSNANDTLGLEVGTSAAAGTQLVAGSAVNQLLEVRTGTNSTTVSSLTWDAEASVGTNGSLLNTSAVETFQTLGPNGSNSTIRLDFEAVSGGYGELSYDPTIQLFPLAFSSPPPVVNPILRAPGLPAWQVTQGTLEVLTLGLVVVALLSVAAWRARSAPPPPP